MSSFGGKLTAWWRVLTRSLVPAERAVYARLPKSHTYILIGLYAVIVVGVVGFLYMLGSGIRTRSYPVGGIELSTPYTKYLVGEEITFTIKNNYNGPVYVANNCPAEPLEVYKLVGERWVRQHDMAGAKDCSTQDRQIKVVAGGTVKGTFKAWKKLFAEPGKYRIVSYVEYYNALPYQDIEVLAKPEVPEIPAVIPPTNRVTSSGTTGSGGGSTTVTTPSTPTTPAPARQSKTISLSVGTVKVEYTATTVYVLSVSPAPGYSYEGGGSGSQVEITFKGGGEETQLQLSVRNGQLVQKIESDD